MKLLVLSIVALCLLQAVFADAEFDLTNMEGSDASGEAEITITTKAFEPNKLKINLELEDIVADPGMLFEVWVVDVDTGSWLSLGAFEPNKQDKANLRINENVVNARIYDKIRITREYFNDIDPLPGDVALEGDIPDSWGTEIILMAKLDGRQEVPRTSSRGKGLGMFIMNTETNQAEYNITYEKLKANETASHIHGFALPGVDAPDIQGLFLGQLKVGSWIFNEDDQAKILAGLTYVNIHSTLFPGGEIRGQILIE